MKVVVLNTSSNSDKELMDLLLNDLKAFKSGKGKFLQNNQSKLNNSVQIA